MLQKNFNTAYLQDHFLIKFMEKISLESGVTDGVGTVVQLENKMLFLYNRDYDSRCAMSVLMLLSGNTNQ